MIRQGLGALVWGIFFVVTPVELLLPTAVVWIPLLVSRERIRARKYGFWTGGTLRLGVITTIVLGAAFAPVKQYDNHLDSTFLCFPNLEVSVRDVITMCDSDSLRYRTDFVSVEEPDRDILVRLRAHHVTLRQMAEALREQAGLQSHHLTCANGATVLWGLPLGVISFASEANTGQIQIP